MVFGIADNFLSGISFRHGRFDTFDSFLIRSIFCCKQDLTPNLPCMVNVWLPIDFRLSGHGDMGRFDHMEEMDDCTVLFCTRLQGQEYYLSFSYLFLIRLIQKQKPAFQPYVNLFAVFHPRRTCGSHVTMPGKNMIMNRPNICKAMNCIMPT